MCQSWQASLALAFFGLGWGSSLCAAALLLHVEKSTQWCGSISSCANVPGKELLARKSCAKSTMASVETNGRTDGGGVVGRVQGAAVAAERGVRWRRWRRYHMRKQREQWKVPSLEEVRLYIVKRSNV